MEKWFQENIPFALEYYKVKIPTDNPYTFGFVATWDETYQRFILTKRELVPTYLFQGAIKYYDIEKNKFFIASEQGEYDWIELEYSYLPQGHTDPVTGKPKDSYGVFFAPSGWSISYNPELNIWVSFHDDLSYSYTYIGADLYSFADYPYMWRNIQDGGNRLFAPAYNDLTSQLTAAGLSPSEAPVYPGQAPSTLVGHFPFNPGSVDWLGQHIWQHHKDITATPVASDFAMPGVRFGYSYSSEFEVIHNEANDLNKLFYNFSYDVENLTEESMPPEIWQTTNYSGVPEEGQLNIYNSMISEELDSPGFGIFVAYNSYQCSGYRQLRYNDPSSPSITADSFSFFSAIRRNGADWCVSHFRDIVKTGNTAGIVSNPNLSDTLYPEAGQPIWINTGMTEVLNRDILDIEIPTPYPGGSPTPWIYKNKRKFVDKWIGIRLICLQTRNIVNLLSTKVGIRKYHRHEQK